MLHVFDFDDTLVRSSSRVIVNRANGSRVFLTSEQYAGFVPKTDDDFDYSEFDKCPMEAVVIEEVLAELKAAIALDGASSVVILTARQNPRPVRRFMKDLGLPEIKVIATGGSNSPTAKSDYILSRLESGNFDEVEIFEDNVKNIQTIKESVEKEGYNLITNLVTHEGVYTES